MLCVLLSMLPWLKYRNFTLLHCTLHKLHCIYTTLTSLLQSLPLPSEHYDTTQEGTLFCSGYMTTLWRANAKCNSNVQSISLSSALLKTEQFQVSFLCSQFQSHFKSSLSSSDSKFKRLQIQVTPSWLEIVFIQRKSILLTSVTPRSTSIYFGC